MSNMGIAACVRRLWPVGLVLLSSCFPVELHVDGSGRMLIARQEGFFIFDSAAGKTVKVRGAEGGKPAFARFSPDGKNVLAVYEAEDGFNQFAFEILPAAGGAGRKVFQTGNALYVRQSPDGESLAVLRMADDKVAPLEDAAPELHVVNVKDGSSRRIAQNVGQSLRWFPDSKRVLVLKVEGKVEESDRYNGTLAAVDVAGGQATPLAAVLTERGGHFDLSPDGKKALFVALAADKPGTKLENPEEGKMTLFELDIAGTTPRKTEHTVASATYSPNGTKVLLGPSSELFSFEPTRIQVYAADLSRKLGEIQGEIPAGSGFEGAVLPGWIDDDNVFYFVKRKIYGTQQEALTLMIGAADGGGKQRCVQPLIDIAAVE
ncbi:MAG: hypothetical protein WD066_00575 [Planctomycetaceae bacterium]